jgi:NAD(P)-dependent dehydrogenase (short-subunit alcohol dehydrogenase family)
MSQQSRERHVLVTGASSGIGRETAEHLAGRGFRVFAGQRDLGADTPGLAATSTITPVELDITSSDSVEKAVGEIAQQVGEDGLAGVVNNAGEAYPGPLEAVDLDDFRAQLEVNVVGQLAVTQAVLPLIRRGAGRIVFVGSIGGTLAFEFGGPYHVSKFALEGLADVLRQELAPDEIPVSLIKPGVVSTAIWSKAAARVDELLTRTGAVDRYRSRLVEFRSRLLRADDSGMDARNVAETVEKALTASRPASRYPVGLAAHLGYRVKPLVPDRVYDVVSRQLIER